MTNDHMPDMSGLEEMYPDIYKFLKPHVDNIVAMYGGEALDGSVLDDMAAVAVASSGIEEAMPAFHNGSTAGDFAKAMLLTSLLGRYGYPAYPYPYPYPVYPGFPGRGFDGGRHRYDHGRR